MVGESIIAAVFLKPYNKGGSQERHFDRRHARCNRIPRRVFRTRHLCRLATPILKRRGPRGYRARASSPLCSRSSRDLLRTMATRAEILPIAISQQFPSTDVHGMHASMALRKPATIFELPRIRISLVCTIRRSEHEQSRSS